MVVFIAGVCRSCRPISRPASSQCAGDRPVCFAIARRRRRITLHFVVAPKCGCPYCGPAVPSATIAPVTHTVLIVDDHPSFRASARAILEADGFTIVGEAEDGATGLADAPPAATRRRPARRAAARHDRLRRLRRVRRPRHDVGRARLEPGRDRLRVADRVERRARLRRRRPSCRAPRSRHCSREPPDEGRCASALAGAVAIVEAAVAVALVVASDHDTDPWLIAGFAITAGLTFVAAGLVALWRRPENATGCLARGDRLPLVHRSADRVRTTRGSGRSGSSSATSRSSRSPRSSSPIPDGTLSRRDVWLVAVGGIAAIGGNLVVALVDETPGRRGATACPPSAIAVTDCAHRRRRRDARRHDRRRRRAGADRRHPRPALAAGVGRRAGGRCAPSTSTCGVAVVLLLASVVADQVARASPTRSSGCSSCSRSRSSRSRSSPACCAAASTGPRRRASSSRSTPASRSATRSPQALHDPSLEIVYRLGDREGWVDAEGRDVEEPQPTPERAVTTIERNGRRVAALVHDPSLADEPDTIDLVASAVGLPLENVRLQAELRSQFSFLVTLVNTAPSLFVHLDPEGTDREPERRRGRGGGRGRRGGDPRPLRSGTSSSTRVGARRT